MKKCAVCAVGYDRNQCLVEFELSGRTRILPCEVGQVEIKVPDCKDERLNFNDDMLRRGRVTHPWVRYYGDLRL